MTVKNNIQLDSGVGHRFIIVFAVVATVFGISCSPDRADLAAREQWLNLWETSYPIKCKAVPAKWKQLANAETEEYAIRHAPNSTCRFEVEVPEHSRFSFRASLAGPPRIIAQGATIVRLTARLVDGESETAQIVFEDELNREHKSVQSDVALPAGMLEIEFQSQRLRPKIPSPHVDWSRLVVKTTAPDFAGDTPWAIDASEAMKPYYAERVGPASSTVKRRMLVLGLDGANWDLLAPMLETGELPTLAGLRSRGRFGDLNSTVIPESAMSWMAISTGVGPGKNGVYSFFSHGSGRRAFWHTLGDHGLRSLILAVPKAFANQPLNGVIVGGWTYKRDSAFVYPTELQSHVLRAGYQPELRNVRNVDHYTAHMRRRTDLSLALMAAEDWDLTFLVYEYTDTVGHRFGLDTPEWKTVYRAVDRELARVLETLGDDTTVLVVSDHGWKTFQHSFFISHWLKSNGHSDYGHVLNSASVISVSRKRPNDVTPVRPGEASIADFEAIERKLRQIRVPGTQEKLVGEIRDFPTAFPGPFSKVEPRQIIVNVKEDHRVFAGTAAKTSFSSGPVDHHSPKGIYLLAGPGITPGKGKEQSVFDVAATVLQYFGIESQPDADGTPIDDFGRAGTLADAGPAFFGDQSAGGASEADPTTDENLSGQLRALGYIE